MSVDIEDKNKVEETNFDKSIDTKLGDVKDFLETEENINALSDVLSSENQFSQKLEKKLTDDTDSVAMLVELFVDSNMELENEANQKWLNSLKVFLNECLNKNIVVQSKIEEINKWLKKIHKTEKWIDKEDVESEYLKSSLTTNWIELEYIIAWEKVVFLLTDDYTGEKIKTPNTNLHIDWKYYKINENYELELNENWLKENLNSFEVEGANKVDIIDDKEGWGWFVVNFTLENNDVKSFKLNENWLFGWADLDSWKQDGYELTIDQDNGKFILKNLNPVKEEPKKIVNEEIVRLEQERDKLDLNTVEGLKRADEINKEIKEIEKVELEKTEVIKSITELEEERAEKMKKAEEMTKNWENIGDLIKEINQIDEQINKLKQTTPELLDKTEEIEKKKNEILQGFDEEAISKSLLEKDTWYANNIEKVNNTIKNLTELLNKYPANEEIWKLISYLKNWDIESFQRQIYSSTWFDSKYADPYDGRLGDETYDVLWLYTTKIDEIEKTKQNNNTWGEKIKSWTTTPEDLVVSPEINSIKNNINTLTANQININLVYWVTKQDYIDLFKEAAKSSDPVIIQKTWKYYEAITNWDNTVNWANSDNMPGWNTFKAVADNLWLEDLWTEVKNRVDTEIQTRKENEKKLEKTETLITNGNIEFKIIDDPRNKKLEVKYKTPRTWWDYYTQEFTYDNSGIITTFNRMWRTAISMPKRVTTDDVKSYWIIPVNDIHNLAKTSQVNENNNYITVSESDGSVYKWTLNSDWLWKDGSWYWNNGSRQTWTFDNVTLKDWKEYDSESYTTYNVANKQKTKSNNYYASSYGGPEGSSRQK